MNLQYASIYLCIIFSKRFYDQEKNPSPVGYIQTVPARLFDIFWQAHTNDRHCQASGSVK